MITVNHLSQRVEAYWQLRVLIFALFAMLLLAPLILQPTFANGPDSAFHIYNAQRYTNELQSGVWYPRWLGDWFGGYGAPLGVAYAPLSYLATAWLAALGIPTITALKIVVWISLLASGVIMYELARIFMPSSGALLVGLLYQAAPYRIIDLYGRTALPEYVAFVWLPLILLSVIKCANTQRRIWCIALALSIAGLLFTHFLIAYLYAMVIAGVSAYLIFRSHSAWRSTAFRLVTAMGLGVLLAALYWLPVIVENQYLNTGFFQARSGWGNYLNNFLFNAQTYIGTDWQAMYGENVRIGISAVIGIALGGVSIAAIWRGRHVRSEQSRGMAVIMTSVLFFSAFMSFSLSRPVWSVLPRAEIVAFPWRWQTIAALAMAYVAGDAAGWLWQARQDQLSARWRNLMQIMMLCAIGATLLYSGALMWRYRTQLPVEVVEQFLGIRPLPVESYSWVYADEYLPIWSQNFDYRAHPANQQQPIVSETSIAVQIEDWHSARRVFTVVSSRPATIDVRSFWFPGWRAFVNGQPVPIDIASGDGTMQLSVPSGNSTVTLVFEDTPVRSAGWVISSGAAIILVGWILIGISRRVRVASHRT